MEEDSLDNVLLYTRVSSPASYIPAHPIRHPYSHNTRGSYTHYNAMLTGRQKAGKQTQDRRHSFP